MAEIESGVSLKIPVIADVSKLILQLSTGIRGLAPGVVQVARSLGGNFASAFIAGIGIRKIVRNIDEVIGAAVAFEDSFTGVRKTVTATNAEFEILSQQFKDLAKEIPLNVNELNRIGEIAGQLGITKSGLVDFTETVAKLAATTTMSSEGAAFALARLASIAGLSEKQFNMLGGVIVELGNNFATTEDMMTNLALRIVGTGRVVGMSVPDIFAMSAAISQVGVRAELGGTALSRFLISVANAVRLGGTELNILAQVAKMSVGEFSELFEKDAAMAVASFLKGLDDIKKSGGDVFTILENLDLNAIRVRDVILRTSQAAPEMFKALDLARAQETIEDSANALEVEFQKRVETTTSRVILMENAINDLRISLGDAFLPTIKSVADGLAGLVALYNENSTALKLTIFLFKQLIIFGGSILVFWGTYKSTLLAVRKAMVALKLETAAMTVTMGRLSAALSVTLALLSAIVIKKAKDALETKNLVDAVGELREAQDQLNASQKYELLSNMLGDNPDEQIKTLLDAGVNMNKLFEAITNGVNSNDAFKLKNDLIGIIESMRGVGELSVNGVSSIEEIGDAIRSEVSRFATLDEENRTKYAAANILLRLLEGIEENEPAIKAKQEVLRQLGSDTGKALEEGLQEGLKGAEAAINYFETFVRDNLFAGLDIFDELASDVEVDVDQMLANLVVRLEREKRFKEGMEELAKRGYLGLVNQFSELGEEYAPVIEAILAKGFNFGAVLEGMIEELDPDLYLELGMDGSPVWEVLAQQYEQKGRLSAGRYHEGVLQGIKDATRFGDDFDDIVGDSLENLPSSIARNLLSNDNVMVTGKALEELVKASIMDSGMDDLVADTIAGLTADVMTEAEKTLAGFFDVVDFFQTRIDKDRATKSYNQANKDLNSLLAEQTDIINDIADAQERVDELKEKDAQRTASEKLRIRDLTRARDFLKKAVEEGQDATLELAVAEEELAAAEEEADSPTRELIEAEQELADLYERQANLPNLVADARDNLTDATFRLAEAEAELFNLNQYLPTLSQQQMDYFMTIATGAGIAKSFVDDLNNSLGVTPAGVASSSSSANSYVVQAGDTLSSIASKLGMSWQSLYEKNKSVIGGDPNMIKPGQILGYAKGGFLPTGGMGIVGERGMELIQSTSSGTKITPLANSGNVLSGANVTVNVTGFPTDPIVARNIAERIRRELVNLEEEGRGGLLSR